MIRAVGYGVAAYAASWLLQPPVLYLIDATRPLPLTLGG